MTNLSENGIQPSPNATVRGWGINAPGWSPIINRFFRSLDDRSSEAGLIVSSVDIKYGSLRIEAHWSAQTSPENELELVKAIYLAEARSFRTCPDCGEPARYYDGAFSPDVACEQHAPKGRTPVDRIVGFTNRDGVRYVYDPATDDLVLGARAD